MVFLVVCMGRVKIVGVESKFSNYFTNEILKRIVRVEINKHGLFLFFLSENKHGFILTEKSEGLI